MALPPPCVHTHYLNDMSDMLIFVIACICSADAGNDDSAAPYIGREGHPNSPKVPEDIHALVEEGETNIGPWHPDGPKENYSRLEKAIHDPSRPRSRACVR